MSTKRELTEEKRSHMKAAAAVALVVLVPKSCASWVTEQLGGVVIGESEGDWDSEMRR